MELKAGEFNNESGKNWFDTRCLSIWEWFSNHFKYVACVQSRHFPYINESNWRICNQANIKPRMHSQTRRNRCVFFSCLAALVNGDHSHSNVFRLLSGLGSFAMKMVSVFSISVRLAVINVDESMTGSDRKPTTVHCVFHCVRSDKFLGGFCYFFVRRFSEKKLFFYANLIFDSIGTKPDNSVAHVQCDHFRNRDNKKSYSREKWQKISSYIFDVFQVIVVAEFACMC